MRRLLKNVIQFILVSVKHELSNVVSLPWEIPFPWLLCVGPRQTFLWDSLKFLQHILVSVDDLLAVSSLCFPEDDTP